MALPSNRVLAELLAAAAELNQDRLRSRALRRASRAALTWTLEASSLLEAGTPLTALDRVGPWIASEMLRLVDEGTPADPPPLRQAFLTLTEASLLARGFHGELHTDLQMHTEWSDGHSTALEMAEAAQRRGYRHVLVTDHSQGLPIANGLDDERLLRQRDELDAVAARLGMRVLQGLEMNIDVHGEGDMEPVTLGRLDLILGAFHSKLRLRDDQTQRYLAALRNPWVDVLAHPRCRIYNFRIGLSADWPSVFALARELDKAVEVDGYADRQDLDLELLRVAADSGVRVSLGSDAHHVVDLEYMTFAVGAAVAAGIAPERIINCMPADELMAWARQHRRGALVTANPSTG